MAGRRLVRAQYRGVVAVVAVVAVAVGTVATRVGASARPPGQGSGGAGEVVTGPEDRAGTYDVRRVQRVGVRLGAAEVGRRERASAGLRRQLGRQTVIDVDPLTGTPRQVGRLDGFLTGPSRSEPSRVVLDWVRAHRDLFGLDAAGIAGLKLTRDYVDVGGTHHLSWTQLVGGVPLFGNGLQASVTGAGRLVNVYGSPVSKPDPVAAAPKVTAVGARAVALRDVDRPVAPTTAKSAADRQRTTTFSDGDRAHLVAFQTPQGTRLAWQLYLTPGTAQAYTHVVDAGSGTVLYRRNLVNRANDPDAGNGGYVFDHHPGALRGGKLRYQRFPRNWLPAGSDTLSGNNAHVFTGAKVGEQEIPAPSPGEEIKRRDGKGWTYPFVDFTGSVNSRWCSAQYPCSWDPGKAGSWQANSGHSGTQLFYFLNTFHDHLLAKPIGFTEAAGNFQVTNVTGKGKGKDAVQGAAILDADAEGGLPNGVNNAWMETPPDGRSPTMGMYLWQDDPNAPFLVAAGSDDPAIVFHEYTHGLSNRLVVDANGNSTLDTPQGAAMGEGWSDWYAMDFLAARRLQPDTAALGEMSDRYVSHGQKNLIRTEPTDCPVGATSPACPGSPGAGKGGYTLGDYGKVVEGLSEHADGEIWAQTLWDLRTELGSRPTQSLVTRAMELSPARPSFLDMRNAILQADTIAGGKHHKRIWKVFAARGMGFFAAVTDGDDAAPAEDFHTPPGPNAPTGTLTGRFTDATTHQPITGARIAFGGHASGFPGDFTATTGADGRYRIDGLPFGTYRKVTVSTDTYDIPQRTVTIDRPTVVLDQNVERDWAASGGGAKITAFTGEDGPFCGPANAIDLSHEWGWVTNIKLIDGKAQPMSITVKLPTAVDLTAFGVNPASGCNNDPTMATADYTIETSADGADYHLAAKGTFETADQGRVNRLPLSPGTATKVNFIRFTILSTQVPGGMSACGSNPQPPTAPLGCLAGGLAELEAFGTASK